MIGIRLTTPALATPSHMAATTPSPTPAQSETFVKELVRSLNIQLDNLCQFLPQERVADFAKLNAQELLVETQRAVGKGACKEGGGMCVALGLLSCVVLGDTGGGGCFSLSRCRRHRGLTTRFPLVPAAVANLWTADLMDIHNELIELQKEDVGFGSRMQEKELNLVRLGLGGG